MAATWIETVTGSFEDKKRWRKYKARKQDLPQSYRTAINGLERYIMYAGAIVKGDILMQMMEDLLDLFEQAAADSTSIRNIVGDDPVEFAEDFLLNYEDGRWVNKERTRLNDAIDKAVREA
ncbi:DUF1048 domain-containing protein [Leucobacter insecticola]|uniref:DUF1048 domain-containing protein n=1 Tax=Leucobacter insecticola TaxID=2714934 RepID=A0A6G8FJR1_9MICO|nr:DUF1048 domain-containing protein [Leucobacter insecticola]QIM16594.1 DUF1048 domain-containing protein [Leucobacter insecticola]